MPTNTLHKLTAGGVAETLTKFMHAQTGHFLYDFVGVLMRKTLPRMTKGWRRGGRLNLMSGAVLRAYRKRAAGLRPSR